MRILAAAFLVLMSGSQAWGGETVEVCFNYGCLGSSAVRFDAAQLEAVEAVVREAADAADERAALAVAVGMLYRAAGQQAPISADRAGNYLDDAAHGRMDCIDHSTTTTRFLQLLDSRGAIRHHRVLEPVRRMRFFLMQHLSAAVEELAPPTPKAPQAPPVAVSAALAALSCECGSAYGDSVTARRASADVSPHETRYVIDSWFVEQGEPAVVLPLKDWLNGEGPNVP